MTHAAEILGAAIAGALTAVTAFLLGWYWAGGNPK
jgi:hypothetical protein